LNKQIIGVSSVFVEQTELTPIVPLFQEVGVDS